MQFDGIELCCPQCRGDLAQPSAHALRCSACAREFPIVLGIPDLRVFSDPYIAAAADRTKGEMLARSFVGLNFAESVERYYEQTAAVPTHDARRYSRGVLAGAARATSALAQWCRAANLADGDVPGPVLDLGCGTAPVTAAIARQRGQVVGVDIAFRWLVVARQRLAEAGCSVPLVCACAEALPFPAEAFRVVVADSVLEHVRDQDGALRECRRVLRSGGHLWVATPNRYSLGPDPHVGLWGGGYLPPRWLAAYVRRHGGIPPRRALLSPRMLRRRIEQAGFRRPRISLPDIAPGQRAAFAPAMRVLVDLYHLLKRLPGSRQLLRVVGPMLQAVSQKPTHPMVSA